MKGEGAALLALASSVADGDVVDWAQAVGGARDSGERALIDRLRIIATIGQVHRTADELERARDRSPELVMRALVRARVREDQKTTPPPQEPGKFGQMRGRPSSSITRWRVPGGRTCKLFRNSMIASFCPALSAS